MKNCFNTQAKMKNLGPVSMEYLIHDICHHEKHRAHFFHKVDGKGQSDFIVTLGFRKLEDLSVGNLSSYFFYGNDTYVSIYKNADELTKFDYDGDIVYMVRFGLLQMWIELE